MRVPNFHTAPKGHLIKIRTFLRKVDPYLGKINSQDVLKGLDLNFAPPKRHLIKIRTFVKKIDSYLENCKFARRFEGLRLDQIS